MKFSSKGTIIIGIVLTILIFATIVLLGAHILTYRRIENTDYSSQTLIYPSAFSNINFPEVDGASIYQARVTKGETKKESQVFLEVKNPEYSLVPFYDDKLQSLGWEGPDFDYSGEGVFVGYYSKESDSLTLIISDIDKPIYDVKVYLSTKL